MLGAVVGTLITSLVLVWSGLMLWALRRRALSHDVEEAIDIEIIRDLNEDGPAAGKGLAPGPSFGLAGYAGTSAGGAGSGGASAGGSGSGGGGGGGGSW